MKNVQIKFCGVTLNKSGVVYGDLIQAPCELPTIRVYDVAECKKSGDCVFEDYEVYPESISQLVGYDADKDEVYEGDELYYYRCYCVSGEWIRKNKEPEGICKVISEDRLEGLADAGLADHVDYEFLLKRKIDDERRVIGRWGNF